MKIHLASVYPAQHSRAGQPVSPIGYTSRGPIWPGAGGAPEDGDDDGGEPTDAETDEDGEEGGESGDKANPLLDEVEKYKSRMQAADKRASELENKLKQLDDAKKDELTKATERVAELEKEREARDSELADLRLQNAFLAVNEITWNDPEDALALAERGGYLEGLSGDDGTVDAAKLKLKLQELAKKKPHLVKANTDDGKHNKDDGEKPPRTGAPVGSSRKKNKDEPELSKLKDRYRLLNR